MSAVSAVLGHGAGRATAPERRIARLERAMAELRRIAGDGAQPHPALADALGAFADDVVRTRALMRRRSDRARSLAAVGDRDV